MSRLVRVIRVRRRLDSVSLAILTGLAALLGAQPARACSVCFGDPSSGLSQGAQAGMLVLLGVIGVVLTGLASLFGFWMRRAANLRALQEAGPAATADRTESSRPAPSPPSGGHEYASGHL